MDNVAIRLLITISRFQRTCGTARKQSLTSNSQARASCAQATGRAGAGAGAGPGLLAAPTPPLRSRLGAG